MADFTLTVKTDSSAELLDIVSKIAGSMPLPAGKSAQLPEHQHIGGRQPLELPNVAGAQVLTPGIAGSDTRIDDAPIGDVSGAVAEAYAPDRDGHGIKRDDRIHANAADPFKADSTWKRRKNVPDEQYDEIHLELVREAKAAGLYTGPAIPELELESQVGPFYWSHPESSSFGMVDTLAQLEEMLDGDQGAVEIDEEQYLKLQAEDSAVTVTVENNTDAQLEVTQEPEVVTITAVAPPAPVPAAPTPTGMSAEATPTYQQAVVALFNAGGPTAPQVALQAMGLTIATQATPQQLRDMVTAAEMVAALGIAPADKPTKGPEHTREALVALGYVAS
ncbi:MAG: hypothetical protein ACRCXB_23290 [Aeromonadaceae bacterium]